MSETIRHRARHGPEVVRGQVWCDGEAVSGFELANISEYLDKKGTLVWADLQCPTHETLATLADELDLDRFAIEDAVEEAERVKTVSYARHTFLMVYAVTNLREPDQARDFADTDNASGHLFELHRISMFVRSNMLITVRLSDAFDMDTVVERWREIGGERYGVGALVHGVLDVVVDGHFDAVRSLDDAIEQLEEMLFDDSIPSQMLQRRSFQVRKELVRFRRVVLPLREVIAGIQRRRLDNDAPTELDPHFSDLYDHTLRVAEWTESLRDMVTTVFETNLSLADARLNTVMKKLTGWAGIIAVPTAITGYYGQNVPFPGFSNTLGFWSSTVLLITAVTVLYLMFKKRDWI